MVIGTSSKCVKMKLPNDKVVDVLSPVLDEISKWLQNEIAKPEAGGYIVGYQHEKTGNISLEAVSHPYSFDLRERIQFKMRDPLHDCFLRKAQKRKSYYMGVWHTHPQRIPEPSSIDWDDWKATVCSDKTGCQFVFFVIAGTVEWRLWIGDLQTGEISEAQEYKKNAEGIYLKDGV